MVSAAAARKTVSVLFCDLADSTVLGERLDPEPLRELMGEWYEEMQISLEHHGGTVEKFVGDAVMAVFGLPQAHEDDALRAIRAALEMQSAVGRLNASLAGRDVPELRLRIGINTGEVVTGDGVATLATGDAVNTAKRLEEAAGGGEILIGAMTERLVRHATRLDPVGPVEAKGKRAPVEAWRVLGVIAGADSFARRLDTPLVGRTKELRVLRDGLTAGADRRECRLMTVIGTAGVGKTRLVSELVAEVGTYATVASGRCLPYGDGITFWPLTELIQRLGGEQAVAEAIGDDPDAALVVERLRVLAGRGTAPPEEIFWAVRRFFELLARERPLALVVEDVHWAEPTLLDLAEHLGDWTRDAPLLLLCLARPEFLDGRPGWGGELMTLQPLSEVESEELIRNVLDGASLDDEMRARIRGVAEGNPLFVEQLLALIAEGGDPGDVPPTIHALLAARLDALPDEERDVLERASVIGHDFEWEALGELASDRRRPPGAQLAALVRNELIRPHDAIADTFSFRHALIRDAAYARLPKERRSQLHERFAGWLDGRGEEFEEIVGYHLEQAHRWLAELGPADERAVDLAERAATRLLSSARRALARSDGPAAANLFERAESLLSADDPRRLELLTLLGRALRDAARMERAEAVLSEAADRAREVGEEALAATAALALAELRLHAATVTRREVLEEVDAATRVYEKHGDEAGLARALALAGKLSFWAGHCAAAFETLDRAAGHARNAGDRYQEAECLQYILAVIVYGPTPASNGLAFLESVRTRLEGNRKLEMAQLNVQARLEAMTGRFESARSATARAATLAEGVLEVELYSHTLVAVADVELLAGDAAAAERSARAACERLEAINELGYLSSAVPTLLEALYRLDRGDEALRLSERWDPARLTAPEDVDAQAGWRSVRAKLLAHRGNAAEAERLAREAVSLASATDYVDLHADACAALGEVLRAAGRRDESDAALAEALALYEKKGNVSAAAALRALSAEPPVGV